MNEQSFLQIKKEYENFINELERNIKNNNISLYNKESYIIKDSWINDYFQYNNNIGSETSYIKSNESPEIINDISSAINCLKNNTKFKIISKQLMISIFSNTELNNYKSINYYTGNNKIIIEYKEIDENKYFLLINPFFDITQKFYFTIKKEYGSERYQIYKDLLSKESNYDTYLTNNSKYNSIIHQFEEISNNKTTNIYFKKHAKNNQAINKNDEILKILIYIYYFEKSLLNKKEDIFDENQEYYLINSKWFNELKNYYNYNKLNNSLNKYFRNNRIESSYYNLSDEDLKTIILNINKDINL